MNVIFPLLDLLSQILESILNVKPSAFTLDVATLASRREYLNLDKWLSDNVTEYGLDFLRTLAGFLEKKMAIEKNSRFDEDPTVENRATVALSPHTITIILRVIRTKYVLFLWRPVVSADF
jgi:CCR4-NOT transcription complex subunit 1